MPYQIQEIFDFTPEVFDWHFPHYLEEEKMHEINQIIEDGSEELNEEIPMLSSIYGTIYDDHERFATQALPLIPVATLLKSPIPILPEFKEIALKDAQTTRKHLYLLLHHMATQVTDKQVDMDKWVASGMVQKVIPIAFKERPCGSVACLLGHASGIPELAPMQQDMEKHNLETTRRFEKGLFFPMSLRWGDYGDRLFPSTMPITNPSCSLSMTEECESDLFQGIRPGLETEAVERASERKMAIARLGRAIQLCEAIMEVWGKEKGFIRDPERLTEGANPHKHFVSIELSV